MNDEINNEAHLIDDEELDTTAPGSREPSEWQMPEPVFRRTSGKLAAGFEKNYPAAGSPTSSDDAAPDDDPNPTPYVEPTPSNPTVKLVLVLLGIAAMIAFIAVFLTVVYFFFLR